MINCIKQGRTLKLLSEYLTISRIAGILKKSPKTVYKAFSAYQKKGWINADRSLTNDGLKKVELALVRVKKVEKKGRISLIQSNDIRLHNLVFSVSIPSEYKLENKIVEIKQLREKEIDMGTWKAQQIVINNRKVWINPKRIIFYMGNYYAKTSLSAFKEALNEFKTLINKVEQLLNIKLSKRGSIDFSISRQHYALVKNQLAEQYNKDDKKLFIYDDENRLRLLIDNSLNLNEFEAVDKRLSQEDSTTVQDYFKDIIQKEHFLPSQEKLFLGEIIKNQHEFSLNLKKHLEVLDKIGDGIEKLDKTLEKKPKRKKFNSSIG